MAAEKLSAYAVYRSSKEAEQEKENSDHLNNKPTAPTTQTSKDGSLFDKTKAKFKPFSIRLHDLAYSPALGHKIMCKRRLLGKKGSGGLKRLKRKTSGIKKSELPSKRQERVGASEVTSEATPPVGLVEECWKSRIAFLQLFNADDYLDSRDAAKELFEWLIYPVEVEKFMKDLWERKPLLVKRHRSYYNTGLFSCAELDQILRENYLEFGQNIDITRYNDGIKEVLNPDGRAHPSLVWDYYQRGCSVRLLNPQTYSTSMWRLNSTLQEYFGSCVGANVYLTPAGTQGFAPHYDDIEAFVIQLEGRKKWKLYMPRSEGETLPRFSSGNFQQDEIGEAILDVVLETGDVLYFPRGFIHQAESLPDSHSLHVTVSAAQKNTWMDLLEKAIPMSLQIAVEQDKSFREALPLDYMSYMGTVHSNDDEAKRSWFGKKLAGLISKLLHYIPVDDAADQMAALYMHDSLPPCLTEREKEQGVWNSSARWNQNATICQLNLSTEIKLIRHGAVRVVAEPRGHVVYYTLENSRLYHERDTQYLDLDEEAIPAMHHLIAGYPGYVSISDLPIEGEKSKVDFATVLYSKGIILIRN